MFYDALSIAVIAMYVVALVLLGLAHWWDEQADQFERIAGILGLVAGLATLATNVITVTDGDLYEASADWVLLLVTATIVPVLTIVGAVMTLRGWRGGVPVLVTGACLWLVTCGVGFIVTLNGGL